MTRYLKEADTLFVHIPRTGGMWINKALKVSGIPVSRWNQTFTRSIPKKHALIGHIPPDNRASVKVAFAFVRHPLDYYKSVWTYLKNKGKHQRHKIENNFSWHPFHKPIELWQDDIDFVSWCLRMCDHEPGWMARLVDLYVGPAGGEFCQYIGRTEKLEEDFCSIMSLLGYQIDQTKLPPKSNANKYDPNYSYWRTQDHSKYILESECDILYRFYLTKFDRLEYGPR